MDKKLIPNSTQLPNIINDFLIPQLPEAETRIILYICRRTFGFHKEEDRIAFSQFMNGIRTIDGRLLDRGTGLARASVNIALKTLIKSEAVFVKRDTKGHFYQINLEMDIDKVVQEVNQFREQTKNGSTIRPKPVQPLDTQKKGKQREIKVFADGKSAHSKFIKFFGEMTERIRGIKPKITGTDCRNLKGVLDLEIVSETELEQVALYFLSDRYYKKFAPSIAVFLSAGILNGLMDALENRPTFWKELNDYMVRYTNCQVTKSDDLAVRFAKMKEMKEDIIIKKTF